MTFLSHVFVKGVPVFIAGCFFHATPAAFAQDSAGNRPPGTFVYSRDVQTRPAQQPSVAAAPDQLILSGKGSIWDTIYPVAVISDSEAAAVGAPLHALRSILSGSDKWADALPGADISRTSAASGGQAGSLTGAALAPLHGALGAVGSAISTAVGATTGHGGN